MSYYSKCNCGKNPCCCVKTKQCSQSPINPSNIEFQFDEISELTIIPLPQSPIPPVPLLTISFSTVKAGDRVLLSGIISLINTTPNFANISLRIVRTAPLLSNPETIYTQAFVIDSEGDDNATQIPFSHIDVVTNQLFEVRYRVLVESFQPNVIATNPSTLSAIRFIQ
ncbi:hypothetical protein [Bacillus sp. JJ722]|uniref:hypothetical protein n=1 Tax=Bacillus sp. JJ722 TaxID=3122973 RepID=UPI002FFF00BF